MASVNEDIVDELISHEIGVRRVIGSEQRKVAARLRLLEQEIIARFIANPPKSEAGLRLFEKRIKRVVAAAYREQDSAFKKTLKTLARAENDAVNGAIEERINN